MELENESLCAECGGDCCKHMGCYYSANDLKIVDSSSIKDMLDKGFTSITADIVLYYPYTYKTILSLKARNVGAKKIDLVSCAKSCAAFKDNKCMFSFENRPSGGKYLVPKKDKKCTYEIVSFLDIVTSWLPYQDILKSICEETSGMPLEELISNQVEEYFYYLYTHFISDDVKRDSFRKVYHQEEVKALKRAYDHFLSNES